MPQKYTSNVKNTDVVILVLGETGSGKSSFINDYLSSINHTTRLEVGSNVEQAQAIRPIIVEDRTCQFPPRLPSDTRLVIVDTPGFNSYDDGAVPGSVADNKRIVDIAFWLRNSKATFGGAIYLYDISGFTERNPQRVVERALLLNQRLGEDLDTGLRKATIVISKWEGLGENKFASLLEEAHGHWRVLTSPNGKVDVGIKVRKWKSPTGGIGSANDIIDPCLKRVAKMPKAKDNDDPALLDARETDIVIPIMGATGAGKSSFINSLLDAVDYPRKRVEDKFFTFDMESIVIEGRTTQGGRAFVNLTDQHRIVIVDTPGFDDTTASDFQILRRIAKWLQESFRRKMILGGVIYLHDISQDRFSGTARRNLDMFSHLCGEAALDKVVLVTSKWSRQGDRNFETRETELKTRHWKELLPVGGGGAHVMRLNSSKGEGKAAWDVVRHILRQLDRRLSRNNLEEVLQIQDELVKKKKSIPETDAAKELREQLQAALRVQEEMLALEAQAADGDEVAEAKIREKEEKLREMHTAIQANKVSFFSRFAFWSRWKF